MTSNTMHNQRTNVTIPASKMSRDQMDRKKLSCWAKVVEAINPTDSSGYAYSGDFLPPGSTKNLFVGSVVIAVDEAEFAKLGIVVINSLGTGIIRWIEHCPPGLWVPTFRATCLKLLPMKFADRVAVAAEHVLTKSTGQDEKTIAYWRSLVTPAKAAETSAMEIMRSLMAFEAFWLAVDYAGLNRAQVHDLVNQ
jgi:hypothetical protein